ncbi:MAG: molybdenum cofactor guanylyltransferase [Thermoproteota archaeon]|nr:molybdenum cofactor guanylyltransferase [Thermoproteota archaeon]
MKKSAVILAGGVSQRLGGEKGLVSLAGKPIILHVLDQVSKIVNEKVVVVGSDVQKEKIVNTVKNRARVVMDECEAQSPLVGALTGFKHAHGDYSLLLPCDTPFISPEIASLLLQACIKKAAAIPRWPNGFIEPLQAAYHTKSAFEASKTSFEEEKLDLQSMIAHLPNVRYVSTLVLRQIDQKLLTFLNVNTLEDLKKAESILKKTTM